MDLIEMKHKVKSLVYVVGFIPLLMAAEAQATIYKCTNAKAEVYYNDKPCPVTNIEKKFKSVKDPQGGYIPPEFVADQVKSAPSGIVVGNQSGRKLDRSKKDQSDNSSNASNGGSSSATSASSSGSASNSSGSSDSASNSGSDSANPVSSGSKRSTKRNVIHKERDYKPESVSKYDD